MRFLDQRDLYQLASTAIVVVVLCGLTSMGCRTLEMTGRKQVLLVPEATEKAMGATAYQQTLSEETLSTNQTYVEMVNRVGQRIAAVAGRPDYEWEFRLIASPTQNAFCLPGGKVAIYEGILPICQNEAGLAVVMSHEIAHALARHGGERMSQGYLVHGVETALSVITQNQEEVVRERISKAYGIASKYGFVLPYSRKHESEADHMGLLLMAKAGYDPSEAPTFWERFGSAQQGQKPPEFLSTHPADEQRASDLRELLSEAIQLYGQATVRHGKGEPIELTVSAMANAAPVPSGPATSAFNAPAGYGAPPLLVE